jgi:hypothetical protein
MFVRYTFPSIWYVLPSSRQPLHSSAVCVALLASLLHRMSACSAVLCSDLFCNWFNLQSIKKTLSWVTQPWHRDFVAERLDQIKRNVGPIFWDGRRYTRTCAQHPSPNEWAAARTRLSRASLIISYESRE